MCTGVRFTDSAGNMFFGRNLDWDTAFGQSVFVTQRGFKHDMFYDGNLQTKHAVIGTAVEFKGMPLYFEAANEVGLACAGLNFPGYAQYEKAPVDGKTNVASYEFPLYIASQFETVAQAKEALPNIAIYAKDIPGLGVSMLHWLIADKDSSIVVEYTETGMNVYDDDLDVLTNQPTFSFHHENVRNYLACSPEFPSPVKWSEDTLAPYGSGACMRGIPGDFYSPSRFVRAAYYNNFYPVQDGEEANVNRLFKTLGGVSMILGGAKVASGNFEYTIYTGGYSQATKTYYCSTYEDPAIKKYSMEAAGLEGGACIEVEAA